MPPGSWHVDAVIPAFCSEILIWALVFKKLNKSKTKRNKLNEYSNMLSRFDFVFRWCDLHQCRSNCSYWTEQLLWLTHHVGLNTARCPPAIVTLSFSCVPPASTSTTISGAVAIACSTAPATVYTSFSEVWPWPVALHLQQFTRRSQRCGHGL